MWVRLEEKEGNNNLKSERNDGESGIMKQINEYKWMESILY